MAMGPGQGQQSRLAPRRNRASAACTGCRHKRKKCVIEPGEKACDHCKDSGLECIFPGDDERKRPRSRLFTQSLLEHIELLEGRLKEVEAESPRPLISAAHRPLSAQMPSQGEGLDSPILLEDDAHLPAARACPPSETGQRHGRSAPSRHSHDGAQNLTPSTTVTSAEHQSGVQAPFAGQGSVGGRAPSVQRLLFEPSQLQYCGTTGQLSYLGPAERLLRYGDDARPSPDAPPGLWLMQRRLNHIIEELGPGTHDYLMACFWSSYNAHLKLVDQEAFEQHKNNPSDTLHYSVFLHVCCLALGFRFADKSRLDVSALTRWSRDSVFHENLRYMVETELEKPHDLTTVQSLLMLSDLECAMGRDRSGWRYTGMACRFAFEIGLTLDHSMSSLPQRQIDHRHALLRACVFYDRMWATLTGHPTVIGPSDLSIVQTPPDGRGDTQSWDALISLMDLAIKVPRHPNHATPIPGRIPGDTTAELLAAATLHEELQSWRQQLPVHLRWDADLNPNPSQPYLFLHLFLHHTILRIHCPVLQIRTPASTPGPEKRGAGRTGSSSTFQSLSRDICLASAQTLAEILHTYCLLQYGTHCLDVFVPHLASLALPALLLLQTTDLDSLQGDGDGDVDMSHRISSTQKLVDAIQEMAPYHQVAASMSAAVNHFSSFLEAAGTSCNPPPKPDSRPGASPPVALPSPRP